VKTLFETSHVFTAVFLAVAILIAALNRKQA